MNDNNQRDQVDQDALFNKLYNEDVTQEQLNALSDPAQSAAPEEKEEVVAGKDTTVPAEEPNTPEVAATDTPPSTSPDPNEWLAKQPEDVRKMLEQLAQQNQYLQTKWQETVSKNRKLNNDITALQKKVTQPLSTDTRTTEEVDEDWKKLEEADPELARILKKREEKLAAKFNREVEEKANEVVKPIYDERQEQYLAYQQNILTETVPNWREVINDPYFKAWKDNASEGVKTLYGSSDARDSITVLKLYAEDMQQYYFGQATQAPQQAPVTQAHAAPSEVAKVVQQRQDKLAKSAPIPAAPAGLARTAQLSKEQMFEKLYDNPDLIREFLAKERS